jgi:hypothetical protein
VRRPKQTITADFGKVKLGDQEVPGIFSQIRIRGGVRFDEVFVPGASGKSRQPLGYEPAEVTVSLRLPNDHVSTPYDKLAQITSMFQSVDDRAKPRVYRIVNKHVAAWRIREVVFKELSSDEDTNDDTIRAELHFEEWRPVVTQTESRATVTQDTGGAKEAFAAPLSSGGNVAMANKTTGAASQDDDRVV